ncbi:hypothetical protein Hanom_Chr15g01353231 [Helianthus anomalus]
MIRSLNNFQVRKRKRKSVLFLLRKRKRNIDHHVKQPICVEILNGIHGGDSRRRNDADRVDGAYCSGGDERDVNPRNYVDRKVEGSGKVKTLEMLLFVNWKVLEKVKPRLGLDNVDDDDDDDDANCYGVDEIGENFREDDVGWGFEGSGKENSRLGLDHVVGEEGDEEEEGVDESSKSTVRVVSERKKYGGDTPPDDDCCLICFDSFSK